MLVFAKTQKIDLNSKRPWRGFRVDNQTNEVIASIHNKIFSASYGYEKVKKTIRFDGIEEIIHIPIIVSIIADPERKILSIYGTSDMSLAERIFELLQSGVEDTDYITLQPITFAEDFLRWLVTNAVTRGNGMFKRISGVKVGKLSNYDNYLSDAILTGDNEISHSKVYAQIRNKGVHRYVIGFAKVDKVLYRVRVYDNGQITITVGENESIAPNLSIIAEELLSLRLMYDTNP